MALIRITAKELLLLRDCLEYAKEDWGDPISRQVRQLRDDITLRFILGDTGKEWQEFERLEAEQ